MTAYFECLNNDNEQYVEFFWAKEDQHSSELIEYPRIEVNNHSSRIMRIQNVIKEDEGFYICTAKTATNHLHKGRIHLVVIQTTIVVNKMKNVLVIFSAIAFILVVITLVILMLILWKQNCSKNSSKYKEDIPETIVIYINLDLNKFFYEYAFKFFKRK